MISVGKQEGGEQDEFALAGMTPNPSVAERRAIENRMTTMVYGSFDSMFTPACIPIAASTEPLEIVRGEDICLST
jgi:hypothetical protein